MDRPDKEARMTVRGSRDFQRILNTLAVMLNISRDEVIERAVHGYYREQVDFIIKQHQPKEDEIVAPAA